MARSAVFRSEEEAPKKPTHLGLSQFNDVINLKGEVSQRTLTYLDSTASALASRRIQKAVKLFLEEDYANTHTEGHHRGRDSTEAVNAARDAVGQLVNYNPMEDVVIFKGTGATGPLNYLAEVLFPKELRHLMNPKMSSILRKENIELLPEAKRIIAEQMIEKPIIITTEMEHHANLLPWYNEHVKIVHVNPKTGELDLDELEHLLKEHAGQVRLVSVSGASNVTGIRNPIHDIAKMAHAAGAEICVDAAQLAPHHRIEKRRADSREDLDYIVMSPHKFGVPNTPGVFIGNRSLIQARRGLSDLGGGMVNTVSAYPPEYTIADDLAAGEEAGTPNIPGIVATGLAAALLARNMPKLVVHEQELTCSLMKKLQEETLRDGVQIIGSTDPSKRVGVVSVSVNDVPHEIVTAYLNDHWNIAVRNGCFCAHPLIITTSGVSPSDIERIKQGDRSNIPGYVRISFGEHNTQKDVDTVIEALTELVKNKEAVLGLYEVGLHGTAVRKDGFTQSRGWSFEEAVERIDSAQVAEEEQRAMPSKWSERVGQPNSSADISKSKRVML